MSRPKTHSKGVTVISRLKPEGLKCNLTKQLSCNWKLSITKYLFRVAEQNSKIFKN